MNVGKAIIYKSCITAFIVLLFCLIVVFTRFAYAQNKYETDVREIIDSELRYFVRHPMIIKAIKESNKTHTNIPLAEIEIMNRQWELERNKGKRPFIDDILKNKLSTFLREIKKQSRGLYTQIIVLDENGLIIGTSDITSDYWHANKELFKKTFFVGTEAVYISNVYFDDAAQAFQIRASITVPEEGRPIGVVTFGIDVEELG